MPCPSGAATGLQFSGRVSPGLERVPEAIREAIPWLKALPNESNAIAILAKDLANYCVQRTWPSPREQRPALLFVGRAGANQR